MTDVLFLDASTLGNLHKLLWDPTLEETDVNRWFQQGLQLRYALLSHLRGHY